MDVRIIGGIATIYGLGILPQTRGNKLGSESEVIQPFFQCCRFGLNLCGCFSVQFRNGIIIMELYTVKSHRFEHLEFFIENDRFPDSRAKNIGSFMDIPGPKGKSKFSGHRFTYIIMDIT